MVFAVDGSTVVGSGGAGGKRWCVDGSSVKVVSYRTTRRAASGDGGEGECESASTISKSSASASPHRTLRSSFASGNGHRHCHAAQSAPLKVFMPFEAYLLQETTCPKTQRCDSRPGPYRRRNWTSRKSIQFTIINATLFSGLRERNVIIFHQPRDATQQSSMNIRSRRSRRFGSSRSPGRPDAASRT